MTKSGNKSDLTRQLGRSFLLLLFIGQVMATPALLVLPILLAFGAETLGGRLVGVSFVLLLVGLIALWFLALRRTRKFGIWFAPSVLSVAIACGVVAYLVAPRGNPISTFGGETEFRKGSLSNTVPEIDQLKLGVTLLTFTDPYIDSKQGKRVRNAFLSVYRELRQHHEFVEAGSALGLCYEDLFLGKRKVLHTYEYVPQRDEGKRYPVIVFLHGSLGNFKGYLWVLQAFAEAQGFAVIAPTFGAGNWERDKNGAVLGQVYERVRNDPRIDPDKIYLAGLSNGGKGVAREIRDHGDRYRGFLLISPVLEPGVLDGIKGIESQLPVLILQGDKDRRIPLRTVEAGSAILKAKGYSVSTKVYPGRDHFLFFSDRDEVVSDMVSWIEGIEGR